MATGIGKRRSRAGSKKIAMQGMTFTLSHPTVYQIAGKAGRWFMRNTPFISNNNLNPWFRQREMPLPPEQSFTDWYKKNRKK
jgi:L-lactate dehydrogenase complex protein LldF